MKHRPPAYMRHAREHRLPIDPPRGSVWPLYLTGFLAFAVLGALIGAALLGL